MNTPTYLKVRTVPLITSIKTMPLVIVNTLGMDSTKIVHSYYNPGCGWELAVEQDYKTLILICIEAEGIVKVYG